VKKEGSDGHERKAEGSMDESRAIIAKKVRHHRADKGPWDPMASQHRRHQELLQLHRLQGRRGQRVRVQLQHRG